MSEQKIDSSYSIVFLMTDENIHGRTILTKLLDYKIPIKGIIIEHNTKYADKAKNALKNDFFNPPKIDEITKKFKIPVDFVEHHNEEKCQKLLLEYAPDIIVLGGTRILSEDIIKIPKIGILNSHPAILPKYKGRDCVGWSILNHDDVGATVHLVDSGIDTGPIVTQEIVDFSDCHRLIDVRIKVMKKCSDLILKAIMILVFNTSKPIDQKTGESITYKEMNEEQIRDVDNIIDRSRESNVISDDSEKKIFFKNKIYFLRKANRDDFNFIYQLTREFIKNNLSVTHLILLPFEKFFQNESKRYIISDGKNSLGFVQILEDSEVGYFLDKKFQNKGIGTEAVKLLMKLNPRERYFATIHNQNEYSIKLIKKLGFLPKGTIFEIIEDESSS